MEYDPDLMMNIPDEIVEAFANLKEACEKHHFPKTAIFYGVAWDVRSYIENRMADLVMGWGK
jgi:hypothetical protein